MNFCTYLIIIDSIQHEDTTALIFSALYFRVNIGDEVHMNNIINITKDTIRTTI